MEVRVLPEHIRKHTGINRGCKKTGIMFALRSYTTFFLLMLTLVL